MYPHAYRLLIFAVGFCVYALYFFKSHIRLRLYLVKWIRLRSYLKKSLFYLKQGLNDTIWKVSITHLYYSLNKTFVCIKISIIYNRNRIHFTRYDRNRIWGLPQILHFRYQRMWPRRGQLRTRVWEHRGLLHLHLSSWLHAAHRWRLLHRSVVLTLFWLV